MLTVLTVVLPEMLGLTECHRAILVPPSLPGLPTVQPIFSVGHHTPHAPPPTKHPPPRTTRAIPSSECGASATLPHPVVPVIPVVPGRTRQNRAIPAPLSTTQSHLVRPSRAKTDQHLHRHVPLTRSSRRLRSDVAQPRAGVQGDARHRVAGLSAPRPYPPQPLARPIGRAVNPLAPVPFPRLLPGIDVWALGSGGSSRRRTVPCPPRCS